MTLESPAKVLDLSVRTLATMPELLVSALLLVVPLAQLLSVPVLAPQVVLAATTLPTPTRLAPDTSSPLPAPTSSRKEKLPVTLVTPTMTSPEGVRSLSRTTSRN